MKPANRWRRQGAGRTLSIQTLGLLVASLVITVVGIFFALKDVIPALSQWMPWGYYP